MIRRPPRSTQSRSSAASDVYKRQVFFDHRRAGLGHFEILLRLLVADLAKNPVRQRQLGMRAGAYAQIVAELPVVAVVPACAPGLGVGGSFVVAVAGVAQY